MEMHLRGTKHLVLACWAGQTLSVSREPSLCLACASITDTFEWSENTAIALTCWAIEPLAKRGEVTVLYRNRLAASPVLLVSTFDRSENVAIALTSWITKPLTKVR